MDLQHIHDTKNANDERGGDRDMHDRPYGTTSSTSPTADSSTDTSTHIPPTSVRLGSENVIIPFSSSSTAAAGNNYCEEEGTLQCCCGRRDCAYLRHNNVALGDLEKDLETAARLGQVCIFYSHRLLTLLLAS
jgi:hypothetical protein